VTVQYLEIAGQELVLLPKADYRRLCDEVEDVLDARAAASAQERHDAGDEYVPHSVIERLVAGEHPLRVWREYRGLSQEALGRLVGLNKMTISGLESGKRDTPSRNWRALANALEVDVDDIVPLAS
jgi:DNA-binding XRE family transcriptional regulator